MPILDSLPSAMRTCNVGRVESNQASLLIPAREAALLAQQMQVIVTLKVTKPSDQSMSRPALNLSELLAVPLCLAFRAELAALALHPASQLNIPVSSSRK